MTVICHLCMYLAVALSASVAFTTNVSAKNSQPKIQLAILLDTSNSMDGLIDQTRNQLWQVVNEFSQLEREGLAPTLEVAIYEYGHSDLSREQGFARRVTPLTGELDKVSEALFSLKTKGGDEYCGVVIQKSIEGLNWSRDEHDIRAIFIAGNEPFTQGPVSSALAIQQAKVQDIVVNTIHAGDYHVGAKQGWRQATLLAAGQYMHINPDHKIAHIAAPQDERIEILNTKFNQTYIPYGNEGEAGIARQAEQDAKNVSISSGLLAKRAKSKVSRFYDNAAWDLVDAVSQRRVSLKELPDSQLPAVLKDLNSEDKEKYVLNKLAERQAIKNEIDLLSQERQDFVDGEKKKLSNSQAPTIDKVFSKAVQAQARSKGYSL